MKLHRVLGQSGPETSFVLQGGGEDPWPEGHCQAQMDASLRGDAPEWIQLRQVLQNLEGKDIATLVGTVREGGPVVVKVQTAPAAAHEMAIQARLRDTSGFIRYLCHFTCQDARSAKEYLRAYGSRLTGPQQRLCGDRAGRPCRGSSTRSVRCRGLIWEECARQRLLGALDARQRRAASELARRGATRCASMHLRPRHHVLLREEGA